MKKVITIFASVLLLSSAAAYAQDHHHMHKTAPERAAHQTEWMKNNLSLTGDQLSKVTDVNMRYADKMEVIRNGSQNKVEKKAAARELSVQKDEELKGIFSESQYSAYRLKKDEIKDKATK